MGQKLLNSIQNSLLQNHESLRIQGHLHLTKSQPAYCDAYLLRDFAIEKNVDNWILEKSSFSELMNRYQSLSQEAIAATKPKHYAMRVLSGMGAICSGKNIFLFFPHCLGIEPEPGKESFGIELIDVWRNVFERVVFPCARTVLDGQALLKSLPRLLHSLEKTIYLASIFHEVGHRIGPWRVSPVSDSRMKVSPFLLDVMGELSTDSNLVWNLREFPEIALFVTLQRIFWFGRRGYLDNPQSAWINNDNDSWITACLWNELLCKGILTSQGSKWLLKVEELPKFYKELSEEIDRIGNYTINLTSHEEQDAYILTWMKLKVEWTEKSGFVLPATLQRVFSKCSRFPEIPQFEPVLDLISEEELA